MPFYKKWWFKMIETILLVILGCIIQHFWVHYSGSYVTADKYHELELKINDQNQPAYYID